MFLVHSHIPIDGLLFMNRFPKNIMEVAPDDSHQGQCVENPGRGGEMGGGRPTAYGELLSKSELTRDRLEVGVPVHHFAAFARWRRDFDSSIRFANVVLHLGAALLPEHMAGAYSPNRRESHLRLAPADVTSPVWRCAGRLTNSRIASVRYGRFCMRRNV